MPAKGHIEPSGLPARIKDWLTQNPGEHRARDVAAGLGVPADTTTAAWSQKVANALGREVERGAVERDYRDLGYKRPVGVYRLPAAASAPASED